MRNRYTYSGELFSNQYSLLKNNWKYLLEICVIHCSVSFLHRDEENSIVVAFECFDWLASHVALINSFAEQQPRKNFLYDHPLLFTFLGKGIQNIRNVWQPREHLVLKPGRSSLIFFCVGNTLFPHSTHTSVLPVTQFPSPVRTAGMTGDLMALN